MSQLHLNSPVGQWVAQHPNVARVLEVFQIDYCCGGQKSLSSACEQKNVDAELVLEKLAEAIAHPSSEGIDVRWNDAQLSDICDHIEQTHHAYLKTELPRLQGLISKVASIHVVAHPEIINVQRAFSALQSELDPHMFKEEKVLFPSIRQLETSDRPPSFPFGTIANPIRMMEHEHDNAGSALEQIRGATSNYSVPSDACNTYRVMLEGLRQLELDMHQHVHKENNILFPRAIEFEHSRLV